MWLKPQLCLIMVETMYILQVIMVINLRIGIVHTLQTMDGGVVEVGVVTIPIMDIVHMHIELDTDMDIDMDLGMDIAMAVSIVIDNPQDSARPSRACGIYFIC
jgi:hypothetical protein